MVKNPYNSKPLKTSKVKSSNSKMFSKDKKMYSKSNSIPKRQYFQTADESSERFSFLDDSYGSKPDYDAFEKYLVNQGDGLFNEYESHVKKSYKAWDKEDWDANAKHNKKIDDLLAREYKKFQASKKHKTIGKVSGSNASMKADGYNASVKWADGSVSYYKTKKDALSVIRQEAGEKR